MTQQDTVQKSSETRKISVKTEPPEALKQYDKATRLVWKILSYVQFQGTPILANFYIASPMLYNFMLVGASGTILSWFLNEFLFRPAFGAFLGGIGIFIGYVVTTLCVFFWNFVWNKKWSLNVHSQLLKMKPSELEETGLFINDLISGKAKKE